MNVFDRAWDVIKEESDDSPDGWFKAGVTIDDDEPCPVCGAFWGHPDPNLDFPNRPKIGNDDGTWWWRCYNPKCGWDYRDSKTGGQETMYEPETGRYYRQLRREYRK